VPARVTHTDKHGLTRTHTDRLGRFVSGRPRLFFFMPKRFIAAEDQGRIRELSETRPSRREQRGTSRRSDDDQHVDRETTLGETRVICVCGHKMIEL